MVFLGISLIILYQSLPKNIIAIIMTKSKVKIQNLGSNEYIDHEEKNLEFMKIKVSVFSKKQIFIYYD